MCFRVPILAMCETGRDADSSPRIISTMWAFVKRDLYFHLNFNVAHIFGYNYEAQMNISRACPSLSVMWLLLSELLPFLIMFICQFCVDRDLRYITQGQCCILEIFTSYLWLETKHSMERNKVVVHYDYQRSSFIFDRSAILRLQNLRIWQRKEICMALSCNRSETCVDRSVVGRTWNGESVDSFERCRTKWSDFDDSRFPTDSSMYANDWYWWPSSNYNCFWHDLRAGVKKQMMLRMWMILGMLFALKLCRCMF